MFVLITYDVSITSPNGEKRLRDVAKACQNYGSRVQNSVFECLLTEAQLAELKHQLKMLIDAKQDSIRIYVLGKNWRNKVETLGKDKGFDFDGDLII